MNRLTKYPLTLGILLPLTTFASGGEVLDWMLVEFVVVIAFVTAIIFVKINWAGKGLMVLTFIATEYLIMKMMDDLSYTRNKTMIIVMSTIAPILTTIVSYWILKSRFRKR